MYLQTPNLKIMTSSSRTITCTALIRLSLALLLSPVLFYELYQTRPNIDLAATLIENYAVISLLETVVAYGFRSFIVFVPLHASITLMSAMLLHYMKAVLSGTMLGSIISAIKNSNGSTGAGYNLGYFFIASAFTSSSAVLIVLSLLSFFRPAKKAGYKKLLQNPGTPPVKKTASSRRVLIMVSIGLLMVRMTWKPLAYSPMANFVVSGIDYMSQKSVSFTRDTVSNLQSSADEKKDSKKTNVILILNESLGNFMLRRPEARNMTTFHNEFVFNGAHPNFFDFTNARAVSATTVSATPAVLVGSYIYGDAGTPDLKHYYDVPSLMDFARLHNYTTAVYAAYDTHYEGWWEELNPVFGMFDEVVSKTTLKAPSVNDAGMNDTVLLDHVVKYLESKRGTDKPFLLLCVWNNNHVPFLVDKPTWVEPVGKSEWEVDLARGLSALKITDRIVHGMFDAMNSSGYLHNTLVAFCADHGETPGGAHDRYPNPDSEDMAVPIWFHIPDHLLGNGRREVLTRNQHRTISNLDIVPTVMELMGWADEPEKLFTAPSTVHGKSLLKPIDAGRIVPSWQGPPLFHICEWNNGFLSNGTHNVIVQAGRNNIVIEQLGALNKGQITARAQWSDLPIVETKYWAEKIKELLPMEPMRHCGFKMEL